MKKLYKTPVQALIAFICLLLAGNIQAQTCTPQGNPAVYGSGNSWIGYMYQGKSFNTYKGYITEGNSNAIFNETFGGAQTNFVTNGCPVLTDTFSVRFRLAKTFAAANYAITVGGDDGYRLSLDGGATWVINRWNDQSYSTTTYNIYLNGTYNLVLEYYENFGDNRISFSTEVICTGNGNPAEYGTTNTWIGYLYQGMNFETYKGYINKGGTNNPNFDDNFGGGSTPVTVNTSNCSIQTQTFSARYRLQKTFAAGNYMITVGGDDGYRLSLDGGATWVINRWNDQSYSITTYTVNLSGTYNMVLEYYQNGGFSRISFNLAVNSILPVKLASFTAVAAAPSKAQLNWAITNAVNFSNFTVQRGTDGVNFKNLKTIAAQNGNSSLQQAYAYTDLQFTGTMYYRLAMTDLDGTITYSDVLRLQGAVSNEVKIFPTLVEGNNLYIESGKTVQHATAMIFDMTGKKLAEQVLQNVQGRQQVQLNAAIKTGNYIVSVSDSQGQMAKQIIFVR